MSKQANDKLPGSQRTDDQGRPVDAAGSVIEGPTEPAEGAAAAPAAAGAPAAAAPEMDAAALEQQRMEKLKERSFKDTGRDAIVTRHRQRRQEENQAFRDGNAEQAALGDAVAGVEGVTPDLIARMEAEARGEPDQREHSHSAAHAPIAAAPAAAAPISSAPLASAQKAYRIRVYGQERDASEEEVVQAGIAALQKQHAADARLQDAATREAQLEEYASQLQAYADQLRTLRTSDGTQTQPTGGSATPQPPDTGAAGRVDKTKLREALSALLRGDDEVSTEIVADVIAKATAPAANPPARSSEQGALPEPPARIRRESWSRDDRAKINQVFERDYGDLLANDDAFINAKALMEARLSDSRYASMTPEQLAQDVGERVRRAHGVSAPAPTPQPTPVEQTLEQRRVLKAQIPITPPAGSARAPSSASPAARYPSRSEYVQTLRQRSGSNSSR